MNKIHWAALNARISKMESRTAWKETLITEARWMIRRGAPLANALKHLELSDPTI